jgi:hypothetical protein
LKLALSGLAVVLAGGLVAILSPYLYIALFSNIYFSAALLSILIVQVWVRDSWRDCAYVALACVVIVAYQKEVFQLSPRFVETLSIAGFCSFVMLALKAIWGEGEKKNTLRAGFAGASLLLLLYFFSAPMLLRTTRLHPYVLDLYLYSFDASLHIQPSFLAGVLFAKSRLIRTLGEILYINLPIALSISFAGLIASRVKRGLEAIFAYCLGGPLAIFCYGLFPAVGPRVLFHGGFPFHPLETAQAAALTVQPLTIHSLVNAMPSLHMTWALLAWWYSRGLSWFARAITAAFMLFIFLSTMGMGEHHFVDLVVAFPFALFLESVCSISVPLVQRDRLCAIGVGGLGTAAWFLLLRFGTPVFWISPVIPWALVAATVAIALVCHAMLQIALDVRPGDIRIAAPAAALGEAVMEEEAPALQGAGQVR